MATLFQKITQIAYPYWAYSTEREGSGALIIEVPDCQPLSSIINVKSNRLATKPSKLNVAFLTATQTTIFLKGLNSNNEPLPPRPSYDMTVIFAMGGPSFTMTSPQNRDLNGSAEAESKKFKNALHNANLRNVDYLELDITSNRRAFLF